MNPYNDEQQAPVAVDLTACWISLPSKEQFIQRSQAWTIPPEYISAKTDWQELVVAQAAKDITFYMQKAPIFDYTMLNNE